MASEATDPADEPLEVWAARRRVRPVGARRTLTLGPGDHAWHVGPALPRLLLEWDGFAWVPAGVARDLAESRSFVVPAFSEVPVAQSDSGGSVPPPRSRGRHRRRPDGASGDAGAGDGASGDGP